MIQIPVEPEITDYLHRKAAAQRLPLNGTFELTPLCNMDCRMCYVRMSKAQQEAVRPLRTAAEWLALAKEAREQGMLYLLLTGGEPFSRPDFKEILQGLHSMGFVVSINSNGTLIDESVVEWLKETPPTRINITLYGASDETYARLCKNPHGFTQTTKAIRLLTQAGISVKLQCSVTPYNARDLEGIMAFAKEEHLLVQATSYMFPPLRKDPAMVGRNDRFTPEEAAYYAAKVESLLNGEAAFVERVKNRKEGDDPWAGFQMENTEDCMLTEGEGIRCRAGKCSFWVTWEGKFLPCGMLPSQGELNVFESGFSAAWQKAAEIADQIRLSAKCRDCSLRDECRACAAMALTESGCYNQVPEYRCRMTRSYPAACDRLVREILEKQGAEKISGN